MNKPFSTTVDMPISHSQLHIYSGMFLEKNTEWGDGNIEQGAIINESHVVFDPIIQEAFRAKVYIKVTNEFHEHPDAIRSIATNLNIADNQISLFSVPSHKTIEEQFENGLYLLFFEECEAEDIDEIFFIFTFVKSKGLQKSIYLKSDSWGGIEGRELKFGKF